MNKFSIELDGFCGTLFTAERAFNKNKVVIFAGSADGGYTSSKIMAELFSKNGINSLALDYSGCGNNTQKFENIPLEYAEKAALKMRRMGFTKIGIWGFAEGAVYALAAASFFHDISCVIALAPLHHFICGKINPSKVLRKTLIPVSAFSLAGQPLPFFIPPKINKFKLAVQMLFARKIPTADIYREAMLSASQASVIPVEHIKGQVLLISSDEDSIWPSKYSSEQIINRLGENHFRFKKEHLAYHFCSRYLLPFNLAGVRLKKKLKYFKIERRNFKNCNKTRIEAFNRILEWLKAW